MNDDGKPDPSATATKPRPTTYEDLPQDDKDLICELKERLQLAIDADGDNQKAALDDLNFLKGDQWPEQQRRQRETEGRPCLTINKIPTFLQQVTNDQRQNRANIKVSPVGEQASQDTASIVQGMVKHIEYDSSADAAYDTSVNSAAAIGFGYFRFITEYETDMSFDQVIRIKRIRNAFTVHIDPASVEADGSDMQWAIISSRMTTTEFKARYPDAQITCNSFGVQGPGENLNKNWMMGNLVRVAEYYRIEFEKGILRKYADGSTSFKSKEEAAAEDQQSQVAADTVDVDPNTGEAVQPVQDPAKQVVGERETVRRKVMWYLVTPYEILESTEIKCRWIPVFPVYGTEIDADGKIYRAGLIRNAKDPAMMYNFWMTSATEEVSLRPKTPYIGAEGQFEGHETKWKQANVRSFPYLEYKPVTLDGQLAPPPQRQAMADVPSGILAMSMHASDNVKQTTGLFDSSLGAGGSATSGKQESIQQRQGSITNYHYMDNFFRTLRHAGKCLVDMIPHYYDTERIVRCRGEDNSVSSATINKWDEAAQKFVNDIRVGQYDIAVTAGPSYETMRAEAVDGMVQTAQSWPKLMDLAGDKVVKAMNWPGAEEIAERIKKSIPPNLTSGEDGQDGPAPIPPEVQQQLAQLQQENAALKEQADKNQADIRKALIAAQAQVEVADQNAQSRADVAELNGLVKLLIAKMPPPPALLADVNEDLAEPDYQSPQQVPQGTGAPMNDDSQVQSE